MNISKERIELTLLTFSRIFPAPFTSKTEFDDIAGLWMRLFSDCDEKEFKSAVRPLMLSLKRFPFPADFAEQMKKDAEPATPDAPQP